MIPQTTVRLPQSSTLDWRMATGPRPRVISESGISPPVEAGHSPKLHDFEEFPLHISIDAQSREIRADLPPIPNPLPIYGPDDFTAAAPDTPEDHAERVLHILGSDPASVLQTLIDGAELPELPPRIPREIANWRAKAILGTMGLTDAVESVISALPEPQRTIVRAAWQGDAKLARRGATVAALAPALGLTSAQIDSLFIEAEKLAI